MLRPSSVARAGQRIWKQLPGSSTSSKRAINRSSSTSSGSNLSRQLTLEQNAEPRPKSGTKDLGEVGEGAEVSSKDKPRTFVSLRFTEPGASVDERANGRSAPNTSSDFVGKRTQAGREALLSLISASSKAKTAQASRSGWAGDEDILQPDSRSRGSADKERSKPQNSSRVLSPHLISRSQLITSRSVRHNPVNTGHRTSTANRLKSVETAKRRIEQAARVQRAREGRVRRNRAGPQSNYSNEDPDTWLLGTGPACGQPYRQTLYDYDIIFKPFQTAASERGESALRAEKARLEKPAVNKKASKMRSFVQVLTTPTADTPGTTLLLHFDNKRYLFGNLAEGTQRACIQRKIGLTKLSDIFMTGKVDWKTTGGVLGMMLTLADVMSTQREAANAVRKPSAQIAGSSKLRIFSGRNFTHLLATARRFVFRKGMPVNVEEIRDQDKANLSGGAIQPSMVDDNIKVWAMAVSPILAATNGRKRSHEVMSDKQSENGQTEAETAQEEDRKDQIRKGVVGHMFDSDWRLDNLQTMKLSEVTLPAVIFFRNEEGKIQKYNGPLPGGDEVVPDMDVLLRRPWPGAMVVDLPPTQPSLSSTSYIVKNHPQRGKFDPAVAKKLGVEPGPAFRKLTDGETITTEKGDTITPDMVLGPSRKGAGFAVIDMPDRGYIEPMLSRSEWSDEDVMDGLGAIYWILGPGVLEDQRLVRFMQERSVEHIVTSPESNPNNLALEAAASAAIRLNQVDPERFPVPVHNNEPAITQSGTAKWSTGKAGQVLTLEPKLGLSDTDAFTYLEPRTVIEEESLMEVLELAEEARATIENPEYLEKLDDQQSNIPCLDAEVITLGTGSALPSKYRNVSATLVRVPGYGNYLFDCGENTLGQLKRVFGSELSSILQDLKIIWISHLHADHHLGTASVIKAWHEETSRMEATKNKKLMISSDQDMLKWVHEYSHVEDIGYDRLVPLSMTDPNGALLASFNAEQTAAFGLDYIHACTVNHCKGALAVVFAFPNGFKVAYSGDCRPSERFAQIGKGTTLLIHEATFDDELAGDAEAKKHSTTSEALRIGRMMGARRILLTHFSQRYQKIPVMNGETTSDQVAIVAFDYMRCKLRDFAKLVEFRPALLKLYEEKDD